MPGHTAGSKLPVSSRAQSCGKGADDWQSPQDTYQRLTFKTVMFWSTVSSLYSVKYVVKVDDDSYVRLDRLTIALGQWADVGAGKPAAALSICTALC